MTKQLNLVWLISFGRHLQCLLADHQFYTHVKVEGGLPFQWINLGTGNNAFCSIQCLLNNCPGFQIVNQSCHILEKNQTLPIATRSNGSSLFIRNELIQQVETAVLYDSRYFNEFIPSDSPLQGFKMTIPDPPMNSISFLMDYPWGFHLCHNVVQFCYRWYFGTDQWIPMPSLNSPHVEIRDAIKINDTWWILGGFPEAQPLGSANYPHRISEFLTESGQWVQGHDYLERYHEGLAKISDTTVLAVGGARTSARLQSALRNVTAFNIITGETANIGLTPCPIFGITCSDFKAQNGTKMIFCLGGTCSEPEMQVQTKVFVLNIETRAWIEMPQWEFPEEIRYSTLAWVHGHLYVMRAQYGNSDQYTIYKFDETNSPVWTLVDKPSDHPSSYARVVSFNRSIIIT